MLFFGDESCLPAVHLHHLNNPVQAPRLDVGQVIHLLQRFHLATCRAMNQPQTAVELGRGIM